MGKKKSPWLRIDVKIIIFDEISFGEKRMKTREDKRMVKLIFLVSKLPFLGIHQLVQHIQFLVHGHFSWSTFG